MSDDEDIEFEDLADAITFIECQLVDKLCPERRVSEGILYVRDVWGVDEAPEETAVKAGLY